MLTERSSKIGRRNGMGETLTRKLNFQQACDARDGLAKAAYRKIFDYLLLTLNAANEPDKIASKQNQIGILDIFGFERVLEGKKSIIKSCSILQCTKNLKYSPREWFRAVLYQLCQ